MKKITAFVLTITLVFLLSAGAFASDYANETAVNRANPQVGAQITVAGITYTVIDSPAHIADPAGNYYLIRDITWPDTNRGEFTGSFNGGNHTITLCGDSMFSIVGGPESVISNFTVVGQEIIPTTDSFGCVAYQTNGGTYKNIINSVSVLSNGEYAGGLFGRVAVSSSADYLTIENCTNDAFMNAKQRVAGFVAALDGIKTMKTVTFKNCVNKGEIMADGNFYAAGFLAIINAAPSDVTINFENCVNNGPVSAVNSFAGGIMGGVYKPSNHTTVNFKGCTNNAPISTLSGTQYYGTGGIFGGLDQGNGYFTFKDCVNNGEITANDVAGGIFGGVSKLADDKFSVEAINCINNAPVTVKTGGVMWAAIVNTCTGYVQTPKSATVSVQKCYSTVVDQKLVEAVAALDDGTTIFSKIEVVDCKVITDLSAAASQAQSNTTDLTYKVVDGAIRIYTSCEYQNGVCKDCGAPNPYIPSESGPVEDDNNSTDDTFYTDSIVVTDPPETTAKAPDGDKEKQGCKGFAHGYAALVCVVTLLGAGFVRRKQF